MVFSLGRTANLVVLVAGNAWRTSAECAYRLGEFLVMFSEKLRFASVAETE